MLSKIAYPRYARVLREHGELDIGIIICHQSTEKGLMFKVFMTSTMQKNLQQNNGNQVNVAYEEESKESYEVLTDTTYKVFDLKPTEIIDVFNEKLEIGKIDPEV